ncbi:MAG: DUF1501 domain-containing protein [Planctomycetota bacterium]
MPIESRNDFPNFAAALDFVKPRTDGIPSGVSLPNYLIEGPLTWPASMQAFRGLDIIPGSSIKVSVLPGQTVAERDYWAHAYSGLFAGACIRGGRVIGETDSIGAYPVSRSWSPADVGTTLFDALGVSHEAMVMDPLNRPNHLLNGEVIMPLFG